MATSLRVLIIGATSGITQACIRQWAKQDAQLFLLGRDIDKLNIVKQDAQVHGATQCEIHTFDASNPSSFQPAIDAAITTLKDIDICFIAYGKLTDQIAIENDPAAITQDLNINCISTIDVITRVLNQLQKQNAGTLAVISSVAGDRGRRSNYIYGAAKGMLSKYLQGLAHRFASSDINIVDIKPGFVDTAMIAHIQPKPKLAASPEKVAAEIISGINKGKAVIYTPRLWVVIMNIIRHLPRCIVHKTQL